MYSLVFIIKTVLYFLIAISGVLVTVPLAVTTGKFNGACLLYGHVTAPEGATSPIEVVSGPKGMCGFTTYLHGIASILLGTCWGVLHIVALTGACKGALAEFLDNFVSRIIMLVLQIVSTLLVFSSAIIISTGFFHFCRSVHDIGLQTCEMLQKSHSTTVDPSSFHLCLMIAMGSSWISFALWAVVTALNLILIIRYRRSKAREASKDKAEGAESETRSPIYKPAATEEDPDKKNDTADWYTEDVVKEESTPMTKRY